MGGVVAIKKWIAKSSRLETRDSRLSQSCVDGNSARLGSFSMEISSKLSDSEFK